jgi:hypothetical protein
MQGSDLALVVIDADDLWPISAKHTAATRPTYPEPTTAI